MSRQVGDSFPEFHIASAHLNTPDGGTETISMTIDLGRVEPSLMTEDGSDVRAELLFINSGLNGVGADILACAATMVAEDPHRRPPQPGTTLPGLAGHVDGSITACHGVFVVPFVWEQGVPHVHEVADEPRGRHARPVETLPDFTHPGRLTLATQLVMLTDEEFAIAEAEGIARAQQYIVEQSKNLHDLWRG